MAKKTLEWTPVSWTASPVDGGKTTIAYEMYIKSINAGFYIDKNDPPQSGFEVSFFQYDHRHVIGRIKEMKDIAKIQGKANDIIRKCLGDIVMSLPKKKQPKRHYKYQYFCDGRVRLNAKPNLIILDCNYSQDNGGSKTFATEKEAMVCATQHEKECSFHGKTYIYTVCTNIK